MRRLPAVVLVAALGFACRPGAPAPVQGTPASSPEQTPAEEPSPTTKPRPRFEARISVIDAETRDLMTGLSWRPGCPVPIETLRLVTLTHWGYDGRVHTGMLVIHEDYARSVVGVFGRLFRARFTIRRMELVDEYGADDDRSMAANNTSAFNCRAVTGGSGWSQHAYG